MMKSRILTRITAMMLFDALAISVRLAAQEQDNQAKGQRYIFVKAPTFGGPNFIANAAAHLTGC